MGDLNFAGDADGLDFTQGSSGGGAPAPLVGAAHLGTDVALVTNTPATVSPLVADRDDENFFDGVSGTITFTKAGIYEVFSNCQLQNVDNQGTVMAVVLAFVGAGAVLDSAGTHIAPWSNDPSAGIPFSMTTRWLLRATPGDQASVTYEFRGTALGSPALSATTTTVFVREVVAKSDSGGVSPVEAVDVVYPPAHSSQWPSPIPGNVQVALDNLAAQLALQSVFLSNGVATDLLVVPIASGAAKGGQIHFFVGSIASDKKQSFSGILAWSAVNQGGTLTADADVTALTPSSSLSDLASTLDVVASVVLGSNTFTIQLTVTSSIGPSTLKCNFKPVDLGSIANSGPS